MNLSNELNSVIEIVQREQDLDTFDFTTFFKNKNQKTLFVTHDQCLKHIALPFDYFERINTIQIQPENNERVAVMLFLGVF